MAKVPDVPFSRSSLASMHALISRTKRKNGGKKPPSGDILREIYLILFDFLNSMCHMLSLP